MDISDSLRDPMGAALFAAAVTAGYIHIKARMNNEGKLQTSQYVKPAILNAMMVYVIVSTGIGGKEKISTEPF
jgi:hypothetical protein